MQRALIDDNELNESGFVLETFQLLAERSTYIQSNVSKNVSQVCGRSASTVTVQDQLTQVEPAPLCLCQEEALTRITTFRFRLLW